MNITLVVVTESQKLRRFIGDSKSTIIPPNSLKKGYVSKFKINTQVNAVNPSDLSNSDDLERLVLKRSDKAHFVIIMVDAARSNLLCNIKNAIIVETIAPDEAEKGPQNYLWARLGRIMKVIN